MLYVLKIIFSGAVVLDLPGRLPVHQHLRRNMRDVAFLMPYSAAVKTQMQEGRLYFRSGDRGYDVCMNQIAERIVRYASN